MNLPLPGWQHGAAQNPVRRPTSSNTSWANLFILLRPRAKVKPPEKSCGGADSDVPLVAGRA